MIFKISIYIMLCVTLLSEIVFGIYNREFNFIVTTLLIILTTYNSDKINDLQKENQELRSLIKDRERESEQRGWGEYVQAYAIWKKFSCYVNDFFNDRKSSSYDYCHYSIIAMIETIREVRAITFETIIGVQYFICSSR